MYYFGTDVAQHLKDIHEILWKVYAGLARVQARRPARGPLERLGLVVGSLPRRVLAYYHRQKFRSLSLQVGLSFRDENNLLDAYWELYEAGEGHERVALKYLRLARGIEISISPRAEPYYLLEEGRLRGERALLEAAIESFDSYWESEGIHEALVALAPLLEPGSREWRDALNRLYSLNSGALPQNGLRLPLAVLLTGGNSRELRRVVRRLGSAVLRSAGTVEEGIRFAMVLQWESRELVRVRLVDRKNGEPRFQETFVAQRPLRGRAATDLAARIVERLYAVR
jgi:hypothetical protein